MTIALKTMTARQIVNLLPTCRECRQHAVGELRGLDGCWYCAKCAVSAWRGHEYRNDKFLGVCVRCTRPEAMHGEQVPEAMHEGRAR